MHHALCNVIAPIFERTFIRDSYANRVGFGTHRALRRFTEFTRSNRYVFQCDVRKYFPSIDHEYLPVSHLREGEDGARHSGVLRGGSWNNNATNLRSANRNNNTPDNRNNSIGFRVVAVVRTLKGQGRRQG